MHVHFQNAQPSKEFKVFYVPKSDGPLVRLMPSSGIEAANSAVCEFFTYGTIDEDEDEENTTACPKVTLKTVHGTY